MTQNTTQNTDQLKFAFFGTDEFAVLCLEELKRQGYTPSLIVTAPDRPQGRTLTITPPAAKVWAKNNAVDVLQPETLDGHFIDEISQTQWDVFVVASYGKIIPASVLEIPHAGVLNIHPSLLPRLRGASPIQSAILHEDETGVTIMQMDEKMDHGPIVTQKKVPIRDWPVTRSVAEAILAREGAALLADVITDFANGSIEPHQQNHANATFTSKISKEDAHIDFTDSPEYNLRKIRAFSSGPRPYFFVTKDGTQIRVIVTGAHLDTEGGLVIDTVIPAGKKEMPYEDFERGYDLAT